MSLVILCIANEYGHFIDARRYRVNPEVFQTIIVNRNYKMNEFFSVNESQVVNNS